MEVYTLDSLLRRDQVIDQFESLIWTERYSSFGDFQLVLQSTRQSRALLKAGTKLAMNESYRVMTVETVEDTTDTDGKMLLILKGRSLEILMDDRIAKATLQELNADSKWLLTGTPGNIARQIFREICRDGKLDPADIIPFLQPGTIFPANTIPEPETEISFELDVQTVYSAIKGICDLYDLGFRLIRNGDTSQLYFNVYSGSDRTNQQSILPAVILSPELDTLQNMSELTSLALYKNVAYVFAPQGSLVVFPDNVDNGVTGFDRHVLLVNADDITVTVPNTQEMNLAEQKETLASNAESTSPLAPATIAARAAADAQWIIANKSMADAERIVIQPYLLQRGMEELSKTRMISDFDGELNQSGSLKYGIDYNLGDLVIRRNADGFNNVMRVTEQIFVSDAQGERSYPTLALKSFVTPRSWLDWDFNQVWEDLGLTVYWDDTALPSLYANAGPDLSNVHAGDVVTLDGSASFDPLGGVLTYIWSQVSGTPTALSSTTVERPTFTAPSTGGGDSLVYQLIVVDENGVTSQPDQVIVSVLAQPVILTANAGLDQSAIIAGSSVTLHGSGYSPLGGTLTYVWSQVSGAATVLSSTTAQNPTLTAPSLSGGATLVYQLVVHDGFGNSSAPDAVSVVVLSSSDILSIPFKWGCHQDPWSYFGDTTQAHKRQVLLDHEAYLGRTFDVDQQFYRWDDVVPSAYDIWTAQGGRMPHIVIRSQRSGSGAATVLKWADIATNKNGTDAYLTTVANAIKAWGVQSFFTFHHEPDNGFQDPADPINPNPLKYGSAADYIAAWRHVYTLFETLGVTNLEWSWQVSGWNFRDPTDFRYSPNAYPGDAYVDWIAMDPYNFPTDVSPIDYSGWRTIDYSIGPFYAWASQRPKPLGMNEMGCRIDPNLPNRRRDWFIEWQNGLATKWQRIRRINYYDCFPAAAEPLNDWRLFPPQADDPAGLAEYKAWGLRLLG